jgi:hypothetical protein
MPDEQAFAERFVTVGLELKGRAGRAAESSPGGPAYGCEPSSAIRSLGDKQRVFAAVAGTGPAEPQPERGLVQRPSC